MRISSAVTDSLFRQPRHYLVYLIASERLYGRVDGQLFDFRAYSGGGRGSVGNRRAEQSAASFDPRTKASGHEFGERGGPIPPGKYLAHPSEANPTLGRASKLHSWTAHLAYPTRGYDFPGGFYIHGRGRYGSDGCIVPELPANRERLQDAIDAAGTVVPLWVLLSERPPSQTEVLQRLMNPHQA